MRKSIQRLTAAVAGIFSVAVQSESDAQTSDIHVWDTQFDGLTPSSRPLNASVPDLLAVHRSHASHASHRSSAGSKRSTPVPHTPAPMPRSTPPPAPEKPSDPLGQEPKPSQTFRPSANDDPKVKDDKELRKEVVEKVQLQLQLLGYYSGAIDGVLGPETRSAIDIFKIERSLPRGSYLDTETLNALGISV
ncbi:His-Xaa-Ser repeat protein HxsA [Luminiphilus sp.]|nr:His-Xaa-Ser repeat protein HxsA [Luminiphilus sp.]MDB3923316.1 His-Xaa-Ser repeat protein HxsA [Luminiphilus sp.]